MASVQNVTQGINADILTNMKSSKKILNKVAEDRQNAATESKEYFKEVIGYINEVEPEALAAIALGLTLYTYINKK